MVVKVLNNTHLHGILDKTLDSSISQSSGIMYRIDGLHSIVVREDKSTKKWFSWNRSLFCTCTHTCIHVHAYMYCTELLGHTYNTYTTGCTTYSFLTSCCLRSEFTAECHAWVGLLVILCKLILHSTNLLHACMYMYTILTHCIHV